MQLDENYSLENFKTPKKQKNPRVKREFQCTEVLCGQVFRIRKAFDDHMKLHNGEKPFQCSFSDCGKRFGQIAALQKHEKIHIGEKPFVCEHCGASFTQISNLKRHEKLHTGEKPYVCELCERSFTTLSNLKQHTQTHVQDESRSKFTCERCGKEYFYACSLAKHYKSHRRKDEKAALKKAKQAEKKNRKAKKTQSDIVVVSNNISTSASEGELLIPATRKIVKKDIFGQEMPQIQDNYGYITNHTTPDVCHQQAGEITKEFMMRFNSCQQNFENVGYNKQRVASFLEFMENIHIPAPEGVVVQNSNYQNCRQPAQEIIEKKESYDRTILSFLEGEFFGEQRQQQPHQQNFIEESKPETRRFVDFEGEIFQNEYIVEPSRGYQREAISRNSFDCFFDMDGRDSRRESLLLFGQEEF